MKKKVLHILLLVILALCCFSAAQAGSLKPLVFVGDADYPPFSYVEKGEPRGLYADLAAALGHELNRPIQIDLMDWKEAQDRVAAGEADVLLGLSFSKERARVFDFCESVVEVEYSLFLREATVGVKALDDLTGKVIAVTKGGFPRHLLDGDTRFTLRPVKTYAEGFSLVKEGAVAAFAADKWAGAYHLHREKFTGITLETQPFAARNNTLAVKKGHAALHAEINQALGRLRASGKLDEIIKKWKREKIILTTEARIRAWLVKAGLAVLIAIVLLAAVWIIALERQIGKRKKVTRERNRYFDLSPDMLCIAGFDGKLHHLNPAWEKALGWRPEELSREPWLSFVHPDDRAATRQAEERLRQGKPLQGFENRYRCQDGTYRWLCWNAYPLEEEKLIFAAVHDVTAQKASEEALRISEVRYRELFKRTSRCVAVYTTPDDGDTFVVVDVNAAAENAENVTRDKVLGHKLQEAFPDLAQLGVIEAIRRVYRTGAPESYPVSLRQQSRVVAWCEFYIYKLPSDEMVTLYEYITERKKIEEDLRQSEAKYRNIVDNIVEGVYQTSLEGRYLSANRAQAELFGYDSSEELIASVTDIARQIFVNPEDRQRFLERMMREGRVAHFEFQARRKDGATCWVSSSARAVRDASDKIVYLEGTNIDITARRQAEEELSRSYTLLREIISSVNEGIVIFDREFRYRLWNPFMEKVTGVPESNLLGKNIGDHYAAMKDYGIETILQRILNGESLQLPPFPYDVAATGKKGWAEVSCTQQRNGQNDIIGVIVTIRDITDKRKIEERLHRAEKMEALGLLAGGVAHDLNNVIGVSIGYSEMMLDEMPPESPLRFYVDNIQQATERASAIVQDMLTMARRSVTVNKVVQLSSIIDEALASPELAALASRHPSVEISAFQAPDLLNISGSPIHLNKTIFNLVANAFEAISGEGKITITAENMHLDRPVKGYDSVKQGDYVVVSVSDTGEGISAEDLPHIFEPFYTKKVMGRSGTGLGLAVVWGAVKDHQGYIDVESKPHRGSTFRLYFPVVREDVTEEPQAAQRSSYLGQGETLLVVDDVAEQRELAVRLLGRLNYLVTSVASGEEAIEFLKKTPVDLVVLDMIMDPGIDGLETYRRMIEIHPRQKAIIVSGFAETERVNEALRLGAGAYVKKPYTTEKVGLAVRRELDRT